MSLGLALGLHLGARKAEGAAFVPSGAPGLVLDLDPALGTFTDAGATTPAVNDGDLVYVWQDQSGGAHHAIQATSGKRFPLKLNTWASKPSLRGNGTSTQLDNTDLALGANAVSVYAVVGKSLASAGYRRVVTNENNLYVGIEGSTPAQFATFYGNGSSWVQVTGHGAVVADLYDGTPYVLSSVNDGTDHAYLSDVLVDSRASAMSAFSDGYTIGAQPGGTPAQWWVGDIWRVLIYNIPHDATTRQKVLDYLHRTYHVAHLPVFARGGSNPVIAKVTSTWEDSDVTNPDVFYDTPNARWVMNYSGFATSDSHWKTGLAYSTDLLTWTKEATNPVLSPDGTEGSIAANGSIAYKSGTYFLYYQRSPADSIRYATSANLLSWTRQGAAISLGAGGAFDDFAVFDPTVRVLGDGTFEMFYAASKSGGTRAIGRATSPDGAVWTKTGKLFGSADLPFAIVDANFGEPLPLGSGSEYLLLLDGANATDTRYLNLAWTIDGGTTWKYRQKAFDKGSGWDGVQVFDSCLVKSGSTLYLFYAGANATGGGSGMGGQIGVATAPWAYAGVTQ